MCSYGWCMLECRKSQFMTMCSTIEPWMMMRVLMAKTMSSAVMMVEKVGAVRSKQHVVICDHLQLGIKNIIPEKCEMIANVDEIVSTTPMMTTMTTTMPMTTTTTMTTTETMITDTTMITTKMMKGESDAVVKCWRYI